MLAAASMGAVAFQKGLGAMHALAHSIGGLLDSQHGLTIAIVMPYVLSANRAAISPTLERLGRALDLAERGHDGVLAWIMELRRQLQIPPTLEALGVREEHIAVLAARAAADPSAATNPLPLDAPAYGALLRRACRGQLSA
jgi:hypothetical protein